MAGPPDRERAIRLLRRSASVGLTFGVVVVVVAFALGVAVYVFDPLLYRAATDSPGTLLTSDPVVFASTTTAMGCAPNGTEDDASIETYQLLGAHTLSIAGRVDLPDAADELARPTVRERSPGDYVVVVGIRSTDGPDRGCRGLTRYTADIQLPYGASVDEIEVRHGENVTLRRRR